MLVACRPPDRPMRRGPCARDETWSARKVARRCATKDKGIPTRKVSVAATRGGQPQLRADQVAEIEQQVDGQPGRGKAQQLSDGAQGRGDHGRASAGCPASATRCSTASAPLRRNPLRSYALRAGAFSVSVTTRMPLAAWTPAIGDDGLQQGRGVPLPGLEAAQQVDDDLVTGGLEAAEVLADDGQLAAAAQRVGDPPFQQPLRAGRRQARILQEAGETEARGVGTQGLGIELEPGR